MRKSKPLEERFLSRIIRGKENECWVWPGYKNELGYAKLYIEGSTRKMVYVHRLSWEVHNKKKIPEGNVIDHLCRNRACVNPKHLESVTIQENVMRGVGFGPQNQNKTHCKRGHKFSEENTRFLNNGKWRACRQCQKEYEYN